MTKNKKVQLTHLAVVQDGTLRLVRVDGEDGLEELAAMAVGEKVSLADTVSAAVALAEIVGAVGGGGNSPRPRREEAVADEPAPVKLKTGTGTVSRPTGKVLTKAAAASDVDVDEIDPEVADSSVMKRLHKAAAKKPARGGKRYNGGRPKRPKEDRFSDDDIYTLLRRARHNGAGGLKASELSRTICSREGVEYYHKDSLPKAIANRMNSLRRAGLLNRNDSGIYSLPVETMSDEMAAALEAEERIVGIDVEPEGGSAVVPDGQELLAGAPVDEAGDSVDDVVSAVPGAFPDAFQRVTVGERVDRVRAGFGSVAGANGLA